MVGYALLKKIQSLGYDVEVINYKKRLSWIQKIAFVVNAVRAGEAKVLLRRANAKKVIKAHPNYAAGIKERVAAVEAYKAKKILPLFHDYIGYNALHDGSKNFDVVVVGSDQVWTPMSLPNKFFNLLFVDDSIRKVAYASSFGVSVIPDFPKKATGAYLDRFHAIGVREQKAKEIVETLSHQKAEVVADPTMLLSAKEWETEIYEDCHNNCIPPTEPYIFCYFLGTNPEGRKAAEELKSKTGYKIITLRHMDEYYEPDELFGDEAPYNVDPNGFLRFIYDAAYVCTDSFHCSAFSIQFHKQFMTFYRFAQSAATERNSRIDSLFNVLGVNREHIFNGEIFKIDSPIDWLDVDNNLTKDSITYLKNALL